MATVSAAGLGAALGPQMSSKKAMAVESLKNAGKDLHRSTFDVAEEQRIAKYVEAAASSAPSWMLPEQVKQVVTQMTPYIAKAGAQAEVVAPHVAHAFLEAWKVYQKLPDRLASSLWGFCVCFFGGSYPALIAAIEAFKATGGKQMINYLEDLGAQLNAVMALNHEDDLKDDDNDGVADVLQIDNPKMLAKRKLAMIMQAVDPERLSKALGGLYSGYMGILIALKFKFAKTVALANSIGDHLRPIASKVFAPAFLQITPQEYHKWVSYGLKFSCKFVALIIAWRIQRIISTVQSGIKGGFIISTNLYMYLQERGKLTGDPDHTIMDDVAAWGFAVLGIWFQLMKGGRVPFPFNVLMFPLGIPESILQWNVTWMTADPSVLAVQNNQ